MKKFIWLGLFIDSLVGSYVPTLWGSDVFSFSGIAFSTLGSIAGIWAGFKLGKMAGG